MTQTVAQFIMEAARLLGELQHNQGVDTDTMNAVLLPAARDWLNGLAGHVTGTADTLHDLTVSAAIAVGGNVRLACTASATATLPAAPRDGWRVVAAYVASGQTLTLGRNGWKMDGAAANATVSAGVTDEWFFRADLGDWRSPLVADTDDEVPWPDEHLRGLAAMLAVEFQPLLGLPIKPLVAQAAAAEERRLVMRYFRKNPDLFRAWRYQIATPPPAPA